MRDIERYVFGRALCRTRPSLHTLFVLDTPGAKAFPPLGSHQAADSESASWDSYPRAFFMARPRITEVSLSPAPVVAASGSNPDYPYRLNRSPPVEGLCAPTVWLVEQVMFLTNGYSVVKNHALVGREEKNSSHPTTDIF